MNPSRREFFRRAGLVAAIPTLGVAKVVGIKPALAAPAAFSAGMVLTAEMLNHEFFKIHEIINSIQ